MGTVNSEKNPDIKSEFSLIAPRILIIDDNPDIHQVFTTILTSPENDGILDDLEKSLFGDGAATSVCNHTYCIDHAYQGEEGLRKIMEAYSQGRPFMVAFVDMRMPPGWDGAETIERIWQEYQDLQIVICTAYSDYSWSDLFARFGGTDNLLINRKPVVD